MKVTLWLTILCLLIGTESCELFGVKDEKKPVFVCGNTDILFSEDSLKACKPRDTILSNGVFVKYVVARYGYFLSIGCKNEIININERNGLGGYDCRAPKSIIPVYQWSSANVIALKHGCGGNYCSYSDFYLIPGGQSFERMNVMAYDSHHNLITYLVERDSVIIENIYKGKRVAYPILDTIPCANPISCIKDAKFTKKGIEYSYDALSNGKHKSIRRVYSIPKGLL